MCGITREQLGVDDSCVRILIAHGGQTFSVPKAALFPISSMSAASPAQANEVEAQSDVTSVTTHRSQRRRRGGDDGDDGGDVGGTQGTRGVGGMVAAAVTTMDELVPSARRRLQLAEHRITSTRIAR